MLTVIISEPLAQAMEVSLFNGSLETMKAVLQP